MRAKRIISWTIAISVFLLGIHFIWIYFFPIPKSNLTQSQIFAIKPGMSARQVILILWKPELVKVYKKNDQGVNVFDYLYNFEEITKTSNRCTWIFSTQNYLKKTLEIYINFLNQKVSGITIELHDLAIYSYENSTEKPFIKNENLLSRYLAP